MPEEKKTSQETDEGLRFDQFEIVAGDETEVSHDRRDARTSRTDLIVGQRMIVEERRGILLLITGVRTRIAGVTRLFRRDMNAGIELVRVSFVNTRIVVYNAREIPCYYLKSQNSLGNDVCSSPSPRRRRCSHVYAERQEEHHHQDDRQSRVSHRNYHRDVEDRSVCECNKDHRYSADPTPRGKTAKIARRRALTRD